MDTHRTTMDPSGRVTQIGFWAGLAVFIFLVVTPGPAGLSPAGWRTFAVGTLMGIWWITEALPIPVTSLIPLVLFPALGVLKVDEAASPYANPLIFLFMGGFMLALTMERWNLHRRVALLIVSFMGTRPSSIVLGFMAATAFLSMWMSNTATAVMMFPIGTSVIVFARQDRSWSGKEHSHFSHALVLGIAYAASLGGLGTLIGTPPNALFAGYMRSAHQIDVSFLNWMMVGVPLLLLLLPLTWLLLTKMIYRLPVRNFAAGDQWIKDELETIGPISRPEILVAIVFGLAGAMWIAGPFLAKWTGSAAFTDAGIAMSAAFVLFLLPSGEKKKPRLLDWETTEKLPWGVLILFGGGLSLAEALTKTGLAAWAGDQVAALGNVPFPVLVLTTAVVVVGLSELASNTAVAAAFLPVVGSLALGMGRDPISLALPTALAASAGFMLPVATPPNTLAYATGYVKVPDMMRAGLILDILSILAIVSVVSVLGPVAFP